MYRSRILNGLGAIALAGGLISSASHTAHAASHREAPLMTLDPGADISDVYAFVSYDTANLARPAAERTATLIMNVVPGQEPSSGPNYFAFDDAVLYALHVDNDRDGVEDVSYEFEFETETVTPGQFIATVALPPVTALEGPGSEGLSRKQRYTVTEVRNCKKRDKGCKKRTTLFGGTTLSAVPSNIGPRTMPSYASLASQGIFSDASSGARVFAGQRAETFAIDLGAVFDTINLRTETPPGRALPALSNAEDANDAVNAFGINAFSGFNVNTIAIELPISRLTRDRMPADADDGLIGVYASTSRARGELHFGSPANIKDKTKLKKSAGGFNQVSRMANPLVNELIIPIGKKDLWNATAPEDESRFLQHYQSLDVAGALQLVSGVPVPPSPRDDVAQLLLTYPGDSLQSGRLSELLRLDLTVPPTPPAQIKRLGPLAHDAAGNPTPDAAGFPNGRRPNDDVTDLVVRVAGGPNFIGANVSDGVGINEKGVTAEFPFLPTPFDGRNRRHVDPGE
jgi:Domain of unknown function (DUF4331)